MDKCSIILPIFNEKKNIPILLKKIISIKKKIKNVYLDIIFVDDSSTDGSTEILKELEKKHKKIIKVIFRKKKRSLVESFNDGIRIAKSKYIIWMDADLSHPPEMISKFFFHLEKKEVDVISFSRFLINSERYYNKSNKMLIDYMSNFLNKLCAMFFYKDITDYTSGFIFLKKKLLKNQLHGYYGDYYINLLIDLKINNCSIIELPYTEKKRLYGKSKTTSDYLNFFIKCSYYMKAFIINYFKIFWANLVKPKIFI